MQVEVVQGMAHALHAPGQADMERTILERWDARALSTGKDSSGLYQLIR